MRSPKIIAAITLLAASLPIANAQTTASALSGDHVVERVSPSAVSILVGKGDGQVAGVASGRSEEHTSELQSHLNLVCRLLLEKKKRLNKHALAACDGDTTPIPAAPAYHI